MARGDVGGAQIQASFSSPTGYEAYAVTERSTPYIRSTYRVRVVIKREYIGENWALARLPNGIEFYFFPRFKWNARARYMVGLTEGADAPFSIEVRPAN